MTLLRDLRHISAHEIVCWQVIQRCNRACPFCISASGPTRPILQVDRMAIAKRLVAIGTRKISISGGEPFLLGELGRLATYAKYRGVDVHITTNGDVLGRQIPSWLIEERIPINLSFYGSNEYHDAIMGADHYELLLEATAALTRAGISVGANYMSSDRSMQLVENFLQDVHAAGAERILFIAYKPVGLLIDGSHQLSGFRSSLEAVSQILAKLGISFNQGVRSHDYSEQMFLPICDESGVLTMVRARTLQPHSLGSVFDESLTMPDGRTMAIENAMQFIWETRRVTPGITVIPVGEGS